MPLSIPLYPTPTLHIAINVYITSICIDNFLTMASIFLSVIILKNLRGYEYSNIFIQVALIQYYASFIPNVPSFLLISVPFCMKNFGLQFFVCRSANNKLLSFSFTLEYIYVILYPEDIFTVYRIFGP